ncbi:MAG TPA: amidohydrolase family protein [Phenylobacterium sp.]|nr:amidohydrolase family protein [Phenylobacterium sp.]
MISKLGGLLAAAIAGLTLGVASSAVAQAPADLLVLNGAMLIDGTGAPARRAQIVVRGEKIEAVNATPAPAPKGARVMDLAGAYVIPGLIDSHVHLATPPDAAKAEREMRRGLYGGITAMRDMADDMRSIAELARRARMGEIEGPDLYFAALVAGKSFFDDPRIAAISQGETTGKVPWAQAITEETDIPLAIAVARGTGATGLKIYANLPADLVKKLTAEAHRQGLPVWGHSAVFPASPQDGIDAGIDVISHACPFAYQLWPKIPETYQTPARVEASQLGEEDNPVMARLFDQMKTKGLILDTTLRVYVEGEAQHAKNPKGRLPRCSAEVGVRLTNLAYRRGVEISAGTDGWTAPGDPWPSLHEEMELLVTRAGMTPADALRAATVVSARTIGREAEMGTVEVGKLANLVVLEADPTKDIRAVQGVIYTLKRGKVFERAVYDAGDQPRAAKAS